MTARTGLGSAPTCDVPIAATGDTGLYGSGNMLSELREAVGAALTVSYVYLPPDRTANAPVSRFAGGTGIATPDGGVAVEALRVGQTVLARDGRAAPIAWIGRRRIDCRRHRTRRRFSRSASAPAPSPPAGPPATCSCRPTTPWPCKAC